LPSLAAASAWSGTEPLSAASAFMFLMVIPAASMSGSKSSPALAASQMSFVLLPWLALSEPTMAAAAAHCVAAASTRSRGVPAIVCRTTQ
jgi:hypothetical protein